MNSAPSLTPLDYGHSFLVGTWTENEVRFWVESRTRLIDERTGRVEDYIQCASCKSEDTFAPRDLFYAENYDFLPVFGPEDGAIFRRKAWLNPNYRSTPKTRDMWGGPVQHLVEAADAVELATPAAILEATRACRPIVAQTLLRNTETGLAAILEYPVKTLNTRRRDNAWQIDTGPLAFFDLARRPERMVDALFLAFVACNAPHFADFILEEPTPALPPPAAGDPRVYHYSRRLSLPCVNRLFAVT